MDVFSKDRSVSKDKFLDMIENLDVGFFKVDLGGRFLIHNRVLNEILGFDPSKDLTGKLANHFFKNKADQKKFYRKLMEMGRVKNYVVQVKKQNGKIITVQINAHVVKEFDDKLTTIEGTFIDISEKYQLEQNLKESEEKHRVFMETAKDFMHIIDNKGKIIYANRDFLGYKKEELMNMHINELIAKETLPIFAPELKNLIKNGRINLTDLFCKRKDGTKIIGELSAVAIYDTDGKFNGARGIFKDITERKKIEQELKESEARYKILSNELETILDLIPGMLFCKDRNDILTRVNQNFADLLNSKKEDIIGKTTFDLFPKDQAEVFRKDDLEVINTGKPKLNIEEVADFPDKKIWSTTSKVPYYNDKGEINGVIGLAIDISERKKIEQELKESEEKYSNLFQYSNDAIIIHDFEGNILEVNDRAIELFNYPKEEFLALTTPMLRIIEEQEKGEKVSEKFSKKGFIRFEFYFKRKDGTVFPAEVSSRAIEIQGKKSIQAVIRDITHRKDSEERLKIFMESAPNTFMLYDSDLNLIDINKIGIKRFPAGTKKEDIIGKNIVELSPDVKKKGRYDEYMEVIKTGKPFFSEEFIPHPKFGNLHISLNAFKVLNGLGIIARDITEAVNAEQKLKESEERYRLLSENSTDLICVLNEKFEFDYVNEVSLYRMSGYEKQNIIGKKAITFLHPDDIILLMKAFRKKSDRNYIPVQIRLKHKNGNYIWTEISGSLFPDTSGKLRILVNIRNITEKKVNEQKLKESEEKFRNIAEQSLMGISIIQDSIFKYINKALATISEYSIEEMMGWPLNGFAKIIYPDDLAFVMEQGAKKQAGEKDVVINYKVRIISKSGKIKWVENYSKSIFYNGKYADLNTVVDITEKVEAEQKLKESEEKYRNLIINIQDVIAEVDSEGNIIYVSPQVSDLLGYQSDELIRSNFSRFIHPDDISIVMDAMKKSLESLGSSSIEFRLRHSNGKYLSISASGRLINENGNMKYLAVLRDITEKKQVEQKLNEINKLKSEFLRRASHELKTPLISIKGYSDLILALHKDQINPDVISKLNEINQGCERLQNIINNLLATSRLESPDIKPKVQREDLTFLIKYCVQELQSLAQTRNQIINLDIHDGQYALFEKEEIHDVISNLLTNAIKYTPPYGKIDVKTDIQEKNVVISIKDNGIGFTNDEKKKIFQQFGKIERYGQGLDLGIDGTGLGLYISKRIVESHGGKIWMESEGKNRGSTFIFSLPIIKE